MEGDYHENPMFDFDNQFQSTPSAWRETLRNCHSNTPMVFQSTPSAWRETVSLMDSARPSRDFNPLPPHGGRPVCMMLFTAKKRISIHSLRMEGDASSSDARSRCFISIHSLRMEGDLVKKYNYSEYNISIHSLRMEGDFVTLFYFHLCTSHFNPLPPHGGRHGLPF